MISEAQVWEVLLEVEALKLVIVEVFEIKVFDRVFDASPCVILIF